METTVGYVSVPSVGQTYTDSSTVRQVQSALSGRGIDPGPIDGIYGPKTGAAVKKFQASIGQPTTGQIDYGVVLALGVKASSEPSANAAAVAAATTAARAAVDVATAKVAAAPTPQAKQEAVAELKVAQAGLAAVAPGWKTWQIGLAVAGVAAIGLGLYSMRRGR